MRIFDEGSHLSHDAGLGLGRKYCPLQRGLVYGSIVGRKLAGAAQGTVGCVCPLEGLTRLSRMVPLFSFCVSSQMPHELVAEQEQDSLESSLLSCSLMVSQQVREDWDGSFHMMQKSLALPGAQGWGAPVVCVHMCVSQV